MCKTNLVHRTKCHFGKLFSILSNQMCDTHMEQCRLHMFSFIEKKDFRFCNKFLLGLLLIFDLPFILYSIWKLSCKGNRIRKKYICTSTFCVPKLSRKSAWPYFTNYCQFVNGKYYYAELLFQTKTLNIFWLLHLTSKPVWGFKSLTSSLLSTVWRLGFRAEIKIGLCF